MYTTAQVSLVWKPYKKNDQSSIKLRITYKRENKIYATRSKELLSKEEFENKRLKKTREAIEIAEIDCTIANSICEELGTSFTFTQFKVLFDQRVNGKIIEAEETTYDVLLRAYHTQKNPKPNTIESYRTAVNWIKKYNPTLTVQDTTPELIKNFELWLKKQYKAKYNKDISANTLGMYMRGLKALFNFAIEQGIIKKNPTSIIKISHAERSKRAVELSDWNKFIKYKPTTDKTMFAYDFVMISFAMCGANIADILPLKNRNIVNNQIQFVREKTERVDTNVGIPYSNYLKGLFKKYGTVNPRKPEAYIFPFYTSEMTEEQQAHKRSDIVKKINKGIRIICLEIGIEPFTTYNIRHTFASNAAEHDIPAEQLMMLLGHKNIRTTQTYLKSITNKLMNKTTDYISSMILIKDE